MTTAKPATRKARGKPAATLVTRLDLAKTLGVHPITISKWERDGLPIAKRGRRGVASKYREVEVRAWLQARDEAARQSGPLDPAQERAQRDKWQRMLLEQTHAMRAKTLLPAAEVEQVWAREIAAVRTRILASYTTAADQVHRAGTLDGTVGVERALKDLAYEMLRELAGETGKRG